MSYFQPKEISKFPPKHNRKLEKQQFPWLDARLSSQIHDSVTKNDGDRLSELLASSPSDIVCFLNCCQEKLNNSTYLHYAVRMDRFPVVEVLLEAGADPAVADSQNTVPFEYCKNEGMREIFMQFREENAENFDWNK